MLYNNFIFQCYPKARRGTCPLAWPTRTLKDGFRSHRDFSSWMLPERKRSVVVLARRPHHLHEWVKTSLNPNPANHSSLLPVNTAPTFTCTLEALPRSPPRLWMPGSSATSTVPPTDKDLRHDWTSCRGSRSDMHAA